MGFFGHLIDGDLETFEMAATRLCALEVFSRAPDPVLVQRGPRAGDALFCWQVGSLEEALAAVEAGCDFVVAQGTEAGGRVRGTTLRHVYWSSS